MGKGTLKGQLILDVDGAALNAEVVYTPDDTGEEVTEERVFKLLAEQGISEGINAEAVRSILRNPPSETDGFRITVAAGTPPGLPTPESYEWTEMAVPDDLAEDARKVLLTAPDPEIVNVTVQKVRVKKKVLKKPKFGIGKPKEEIVETTESREFREPVEVDPKTLGSGWIEAGGKLADITPPTPGKPGKSVYGKPIAPEATDEVFHLGRGIERKGRELVARYSGFFRRGADWAEIIPFQHHEWTLSFSPDNVTCLLDFTPGGEDAGLPDPSSIIKEAEGLGVDVSTCISEEELHEKLKDAVRDGTPLQKMPLNTDSDGFFSIDVSEDKMTAKLVMIKGRGRGKPLVLKEVGLAIKKSGIKGLDLEKIKQDILTFYRSKNHELKDYILAEGTPPKVSGKAEVKHEVAFLEEAVVGEIRGRLEKLTGQEDPGFESLEKFPPSQVQEMATVVEDQSVAVLTVPKGEPGKDIYGNTVQPDEGDGPGYVLYENLRLNDNIVVAAMAGIVDWAETDEGVLMRCRPHRDAGIDIEVSSDSMSAYLSLTPAVGTGKPLNLEAVNAAVSEKKITNGINSQAITAAYESVAAGNPVEKVLIASGNPPTNQGESRLSLEIELSSGRGVSIRKDGRADFKNQDRITGVQEGMKLATIQSPEIKPRDGWDVFGNPLKAREAPQLNLNIGEHIRQETASDGTVVLYAEKSGELLYDGKSISIRNVHAVKGDVGPKTGNVKFSGTVEVTGSINPGYAVFSGGDVLVGENVEAGLVSSDGSIRINQGVKGAGKAVLRAKKDIAASFLEQATVLAVGDVQVKNACLRCNIKANGKLILASEKGDLVGGLTRVRMGLEAANLGTEKGIKTQISFGQDYLVADRIELEEKEIMKLKDAIAKIDSALRQYEKAGDRGRLDSARKEKLKYLKIIEKRSIRLFNFREKFEEHSPSTITVRGTLYPGVILESHGRFKEISAPQKGVKITFDPEQGQINLVSGSDKKE